MRYFKDRKDIIILLSEKKDGQMIARDKIALRNRERFLKEYNISIKELISARLIHSTKVKRVTRRDRGKCIKNVDGLITNEKRVFISVTVGDCLPIYFYNPKEKVIGIAHSGWRGTVKNIAKDTIRKLKITFNSEAKETIVIVGPGISTCHFEIKKDVLRFFKNYKDFINKREERIFINLKEIIKKQLLLEGVLERNIIISKECTYCARDKYFSYRRDKPEKVHSMLAVIGIV